MNFTNGKTPSCKLLLLGSKVEVFLAAFSYRFEISEGHDASVRSEIAIAKMPGAVSRPLSRVRPRDERTRREPASLAQMPSWPIKDPLTAVLGAQRPVERPSWAPGDPSGGRLGR